MKTLNVNRGNETAEHIVLKRDLIRFLHHWGYGAILCEHHCCDVVGVHPRSAAVLSVEIHTASSSGKNAPENICRNFSQGCAGVLVVCQNLETLGEVARKLARSLPADFKEKTALATISALRLTRPSHFSSLEARDPKKERTT